MHANHAAGDTVGVRGWMMATAMSAALVTPLATPAHTSAQTAPATTTTPAVQVLDPAVVLRSPNATQAERDEAARRLVLRKTDDSRRILAAALADPANRIAQLAVARAIPSDPQPDPALLNPLLALIGNDPGLTDAAIAALACYR